MKKTKKILILVIILALIIIIPITKSKADDTETVAFFEITNATENEIEMRINAGAISSDNESVIFTLVSTETLDEKLEIQGILDKTKYQIENNKLTIYNAETLENDVILKYNNSGNTNQTKFTASIYTVSDKQEYNIIDKIIYVTYGVEVKTEEENSENMESEEIKQPSELETGEKNSLSETTNQESSFSRK